MIYNKYSYLYIDTYFGNFHKFSYSCYLIYDVANEFGRYYNQCEGSSRLNEYKV